MPAIRGSHETFNDGLLTIHKTDGRKLTGVRIERVRFGCRTIGVQRFYKAATAGNKVDRLLSLPLSVLRATVVNIHDVVVLETENKEEAAQYRILQIQPKYDARPPALYLSLEKLVHPFKETEV